MVIDDNEIDRYICERSSKKHHIADEVISMESAIEALAYLSSLEEKTDLLPELIFLDINMPDMNGFDFLDKYKELPEAIQKNCIVIMLTTSTNPEDYERANSNKNVRGYLNKPFDAQKLIDREM